MPAINNENEEKATDLLKDCALFASQFFDIPSPLNLGIENYSAKRFHHPLTPAITIQDGTEIMIYFNRDWIYKSIGDHSDDIQFFMFHELRHCNQLLQILQMKQGIPTYESLDIVKKWEKSFETYRYNEGDLSSQNDNLSQLVELDANAYGFVLQDLLHRNEPGYEFITSLPREAVVPARELAEVYKKTKPEIIDFLKGNRKYRPKRNDFCPCGSGIKFKKCHIGKGIYD